eukprot:TRINITY_DN14826_c0_g2_i1.p1 TRINITY_DN14826_c0_g2~~TRINITY_DN14826_c0_g2_i1.p1  ORF type:complete len:385 (+),score=99.29 TRINITY_DN14826_c0_g2_i1:64-1218(+)
MSARFKPVGVGCSVVIAVGTVCAVTGGIGLSCSSGRVTDFNNVVAAWEGLHRDEFRGKYAPQVCVSTAAGAVALDGAQRSCGWSHGVNASHSAPLDLDGMLPYRSFYFEVGQLVPPVRFGFSSNFQISVCNGAPGTDDRCSDLVTEVRAFITMDSAGDLSPRGCGEDGSLWLGNSRGNDGICYQVYVLRKVCLLLSRREDGTFRFYRDDTLGHGCTHTSKRFLTQQAFHDWSPGTYTQKNVSEWNLSQSPADAGATPAGSGTSAAKRWPTSTNAISFGGVVIELRSHDDPSVFYTDRLDSGADEKAQGHPLSTALRGYLGFALLGGGLVLVIVPSTLLGVVWYCFPELYTELIYGVRPKRRRRLREQTRLISTYPADRQYGYHC